MRIAYCGAASRVVRAGIAMYPTADDVDRLRSGIASIKIGSAWTIALGDTQN